MQGLVKLLPDFNALTEILKSQTEYFEEGSDEPWEFELPNDLSDSQSLESAIIGFEITIDKIDAKFKLSQNRSPVDKQGVIEGLAARSDDMSQSIRTLMQELPSA